MFNRVTILAAGWVLHYNTLDFLYPNMPVGAGSILEFYDKILESLDENWQPRQEVYASTKSGISLALYTAEGVITKEWLRPFIGAMKKRVVATNNAGSTMASFRMVAVSAATQVAVVIALTLPWAGAAGAA
ncbi:MAG: hypothetical protein Q9226_008664 [Calogaya cf. arnoldii]